MADSMRESITTQTVSSSYVKQKNIKFKMFWLFMVDSTRESITTQNLSSSHEIKSIRYKIYFVMAGSKQGSITTQTVSSSHVKQKKI